MAKEFDVVVIGAGPGGYVAAIRAAQLGLKTACIDEWKKPNGKPSLGGTCLNVGCIPSKALLESSENYERVLHKFADHGINVPADAVSLDIDKMLERKTNIVNKLTGGIEMLFRKNKIDWLHGHGQFVSVEADGRYKLAVTGENPEEVIAKNVIIATGSRPTEWELAPVDNKLVLDNEGALSMTEVPKRLGVIGAGVIGLEMGSVWKRLGSDVTIMKQSKGLLPACDEEVSKTVFNVLTKKQGFKFEMGIKFNACEIKDNEIHVTFTNVDTNEAQTVTFDKLIVAIGRSPYTGSLGLENIPNVKVDKKGYIEVDGHCGTGLKGLYAIGDVVRGPMLAHKASEEGVMVAELIAGQAGHINLDTVPWVIYTAPEIAWVGKTEQELKKAGIEYRKGSFPFAANGRAFAFGETDGFVKFLADAKTDRILGVHMVGPYVSELITEAVVAMEFNASSEDIARIIHAHPTISEVIHEAALDVDKRALHK